MSLSVTILGSSSALPTLNRFPSAQVINLSERFFLVDCGEGTQIQLKKFKIRFSKINNIFISHLHGDHYLGIYGLISTYSLLGRKNDLNIYCFSELKELIDFQFKFYYGDLGFKINYHFLTDKEPKLIYQDEVSLVYSFPLKHRIPTCGFLFKEKEPKYLNIKRDVIEKYNLSVKEILDIKRGKDYFDKSSNKLINNNELTLLKEPIKSYAFCSDTIYNEDSIDILKNCDGLYHEATYLHCDKERAVETFHSTSLEAAQLAKKANVKKLILGHFSARYRNCNDLLYEAKSVFSETIIAEDGLEISI